MVTVRTTVANTMLSAFQARLDTAGTGKLVLYAADDSTVATLVLSCPCAGAPADGTLAFSSITDDDSASGGTVSYASLLDGNDVEVTRLTVGDSASYDIEISPNTTVQSGATVSFTGTLTFQIQ